MNERLCKFCQLNTLEDETHFLIDCELYSDLRQLLFERAVLLNENFENLSSTEKLSFLMQHRDIHFFIRISSEQNAREKKNVL